MIDYPYGEFGDCSFSSFGYIVRTTSHTTDADERCTPATVVSVSNKGINKDIGIQAYLY